MLDYKTVLDANLTPLSEAVAKWAKLPEEFRKVGKLYDNTVEKGLAESDWKGEAAEAAMDNVSLVGKQIRAANDEAADVHRLLSDAYDVFSQAQSKLKTIRSDIEKDKYLSIKPDGEVWFDPPADTPNEHLASLNKGYQESIQAYRTSISNQVTAAQEADDILYWALTQDYNGHNKGFDSNTYDSLKGAKAGKEQADKDRDALTELAGVKRPYTLDEVKRINSLLSKHEGDPYFAEQFATGLGPKKTAEFWTRIADRTQYGDEMTKESAKIQKSLGYTLATASHSTSPAMESWKKEMIELGGKRVDMVDMNMGTMTKGPYGYQVMSSLMRYGDYEKDFLDDYGKSLLAFEKSHKGTDPKELWQPDGYETYLNFGAGTDHGLDPMAGYMEALGHNPEAAKELFHSGSWATSDKETANLDPDLKYLLEDRKWPEMPNNTKGSEDYDELGHAIEAATLGVPYDQPELGLRRDNMTANVAEQVMVYVGDQPKYLDDHKGMGDSLAKMGAGYIDDLNWASSNFGNAFTGQDLRDDAFGHKGPGHVGLSHGTAASFLAVAGGDEDGYKILSMAQQEYTASGLRAHPEPNGEVAQIIETGAKMQGMFDQARSNDIHAHFGEATKEAERKLAEAAEWKKFGVGAGVAVGVGAVALPFAGAAAGGAAVAAFAVPQVAGALAGAGMTQFGIDLNRELEKNGPDFSVQEHMKLEEFTSQGQARAVTPMDAYIAVNNLEGTEWARKTHSGVEGKYNDGASAITGVTPNPKG
ncbi:DUF6571 family protein [Streptomyces sp. NPDC020681]|uniref:DUF6571 family protein n=1 Tax=Streptomyces sp. NPDC020681 TaxID=3365083 RepID=UPI00379D04E1